MAVNLEGVRLRRWPAPSGLKRLMNRSLAHQGLVSYEVVTPAPGAPAVDEKPREKRSSARRRLRLRSAKLLDSQSAFICECLVRDRSAQGLCLQLMKNIGLPARCVIYDDETGALSVITTIWRRGLCSAFVIARRRPCFAKAKRSVGIARALLRGGRLTR